MALNMNTLCTQPKTLFPKSSTVFSVLLRITNKKWKISPNNGWESRENKFKEFRNPWQEKEEKRQEEEGKDGDKLHTVWLTSHPPAAVPHLFFCIEMATSSFGFFHKTLQKIPGELFDQPNTFPFIFLGIKRFFFFFFFNRQICQFVS